MSPFPGPTLYPFESRFLDLDGGVRYHYLDEHTGGRAEPSPVLCVHGNPTWSFYYRHVALALRDRHRVIVPDHVGCGLSDKPQQYDYRLAQHVRNLETLVERLDLRDITLVVHDWGGAIGMGVAVRQPERFRRLVITNTAAFRSDFMPWLLAVARTPWLGEALIRGLNAFALSATYIALQRHERMTASVRSAYVAPYDTWAHRIATARFVQDIPTGEPHPSYETLVDIETRLGRLAHLPVMFAWGEKDWVFTPRFLERWLQFYPHAEVHRFPDAGHLLLEDAHERVMPLLEAFMSADDAAVGKPS